MNNDYLRVNSKDDEPDIVSGEFSAKAKQQKQASSREEKVTLWSLLNAKRDPSLKLGFSTTDVKSLWAVFLIITAFTLLMYLVSVVSSSIIFLFLEAFVTSFGMPICLVVFFFELNVMRNVRVGEICAGVAIGALYFCISKLCKVSVESLSSYTNVFPSLLLNSVDDLLLFFISLAYAKLSKKDCIFGIVLVVVCIYSGYIITDTFTKLVDGMFIVVNDPVTSRLMRAVIDDPTAFKSIFKNFFSTLMYEGVLMTYLTCMWAIITGALISVMAAPLKNNAYGDTSVYAILLLTIVMHAAVSVQYAVKYLSILITVAVIVLSTILALKLLNYCITRTKFSVDE